MAHWLVYEPSNQIVFGNLFNTYNLYGFTIIGCDKILLNLISKKKEQIKIKILGNQLQCKVTLTRSNFSCISVIQLLRRSIVLFRILLTWA